MWATALSLAAAAPCPPDVAERAASLKAAVTTAADGLVALGVPVEPVVGSRMLAFEGPGVWLDPAGRGSCDSAVGPVSVVDTRPVTVGRTSRSGGVALLEVQRPEEVELDPIGWLSIVVHEVFHLHHERVAGREAAAKYSSWALERRYARDLAFQASVDALVGLAFAVRRDCNTARLVQAYDTHRATLATRELRDEERWTVAEGLARYVEGRWEQSARQAAGQVWGDDLRLRACGDLSSPYGYALGCSFAAVLERCGDDGWMDEVLASGFRPALASTPPPP